MQELAQAYLTHHRASGCGGFSFKLRDWIVVPWSGRNVSEAWEQLRDNAGTYQRLARACSANIEHQREQIRRDVVAPIVLAQTRVETSLASGRVRNGDGLVVVDGLHRCLAWMDMDRRALVRVFIALTKQSLPP